MTSTLMANRYLKCLFQCSIVLSLIYRYYRLSVYPIYSSLFDTCPDIGGPVNKYLWSVN